MAQSATYNLDVDQQRNPKASAYYKCVENHFEELEQSRDYMYASRLSFRHTYVMTVIYKYLDCGDLLMGVLPGMTYFFFNISSGHFSLTPSSPV